MANPESNQADDSLLHDSAFNLVSQIVGLVFGVASGIVLARMLGADARGEYGMFVLLPQTMVALLAGGIGPAIAYYVSAGKWKDEDVIPLMLGLCSYVTALGLILIGVAFAFRSVLLGSLRSELVFWAIMIYPAGLGISALQGVFIGYRQFRLQMKCAAGAAMCSFVFLVIPVAILDLGMWGAIGGHLAGLTASVLIYGSFIPKIIAKPIYRIELGWKTIASSFSYGGRASAANALGFLNYRLDQFLLNSMVGTYGVGIYVLAVSIVEKLWLLTGNLTVAMFPRVASGAGSEQDAVDLASRIAGLLMLALLLTGSAAAMLAWVIPFVYGGEFADSVTIVQWLLPGSVLLGHAKVFANFFAGRGRPELNVMTAMVGLIINVGMNLILIPRFGVIGAAAATTCSYTVIALICYGLFVTQYRVPWYQPLIPRRGDLVSLFEKGAVLIRHIMNRYLVAQNA